MSKAKAEAGEKEMFAQVLKSGVHIGADPTQPPKSKTVKWTDADTGEAMSEERLTYPEKTYRKGDTVLSDRDLAAEEPDRFAPAGGPRERTKVRVAARPTGEAVAPHGQVSDGFQRTVGTEDGGAIAGLATKDVAADPNVLKRGGADDFTRKPAKGKAAEEADLDDKDASDDAAPDYESMTVADLRKLAADRDVNLHGASTKAEVVAALEADDAEDDLE